MHKGLNEKYVKAAEGVIDKQVQQVGVEEFCRKMKPTLDEVIKNARKEFPDEMDRSFQEFGRNSPATAAPATATPGTAAPAEAAPETSAPAEKQPRLSVRECGDKWTAAKKAGTLGDQKWSAFKKAECGR